MKFEDFWGHYLSEHSQPLTRLMHLMGIVSAGMIIVAVFIDHAFLGVFTAPAIAYLWAWMSHRYIEMNTPTTFQHPLWSIRAAFRMCGRIVVGRDHGVNKLFKGD